MNNLIMTIVCVIGMVCVLGIYIRQVLKKETTGLLQAMSIVEESLLIASILAANNIGNTGEYFYLVWNWALVMALWEYHLCINQKNRSIHRALVRAAAVFIALSLIVSTTCLVFNMLNVQQAANIVYLINILGYVFYKVDK